MIDYLKNRRKKFETKFASWMNNKSAPSFLDTFQMNEVDKSLLLVGKPIKESGKKKELKQFKEDMLGLAEKSYINKYL